MSELWDVRVRELAPTRCVLELREVHPDAGPVNADPMFALQLLWDPATELDSRYQRIPAGPLGAAVELDDVLSSNWVAEHGAQYIRAASWVPDPADAAVTLYTIEVTDPTWLEHLTAGQCWDSTAFS